MPPEEGSAERMDEQQGAFDGHEEPAASLASEEQPQRTKAPLTEHRIEQKRVEDELREWYRKHPLTGEQGVGITPAREGDFEGREERTGAPSSEEQVQRIQAPLPLRGWRWSTMLKRSLERVVRWVQRCRRKGSE